MSIKSIDLKFTSANSVPVERAVITREEWEAVNRVFEAAEVMAGILRAKAKDVGKSRAVQYDQAIDQYEAAKVREAKQ